MRLLWVTDLHLSFLGPTALANFLDTLKQASADIILVGGDTGEADNFREYLVQIHEATAATIYYTLGNHDFYGSGIKVVQGLARTTTRESPLPVRWLPAAGPIKITESLTLVGVDGWGDGNCGYPKSNRVRLNDWKHIKELSGLDSASRLELLRLLGRQEAAVLGNLLAEAGSVKELIILTHVPPFPEACVYEGMMSSPDFLPWFTCIETGKVIAAYAVEHPDTNVLVLCGHSHGKGVYQHSANLEVRTGGWAKGEESYGNPVIQAVF